MPPAYPSPPPNQRGVVSVVENVQFLLTAPSGPVAPRPTGAVLLAGAMALNTVLVGAFGVLALFGGACGIFIGICFLALAVIYAGVLRGVWIGEETALRLVPRTVVLAVVVVGSAINYTFKVLPGGNGNVWVAVALWSAAIITAAPVLLFTIRPFAQPIREFMAETGRLRGR
ncbi:hypothetical protein [Cryptosporangium sp. NPDC048952]|uniref:hypothetical protein n=1 Tax=Cryptosporangium sp. NPDC048952 TaxID=3363961 RepID=UPI0037120C4E